MFDRSLLEAATLEFVAVADTHYMLDTTGQKLEFQSRARQTARAEVALRQMQALQVPFLIHLGDVAQEYPETERYQQAMVESKAQLDKWCPVRHHVPGNQDIGDKPDPSTPGLPVTAQTLKAWEAHYGKTWFSFDDSDIHFIILNSQILNTDLPQADQQRQWLEDDLAKTNGRRTCLFLHLPLFLSSPDEPYIGNYDNVGEPDRSWLIGLIKKHNVQWMMSGHVHFPFFQRIGNARYLTSQATSFTRPGFSHLFSSPPPADQGRDQHQLLGFHLIRVMADRFDDHLVRTSGATEFPQALTEGWQRLLTRPPRGLSEGRLGVNLRHPLSTTIEVPTAWPSAIRQPARNDLPLLACGELGVRSVRVPIADCVDPGQSARLAVLRDEGIRLAAHALSAEPTVSAELLQSIAASVDSIEIQLIGDQPDITAIEELKSLVAGLTCPISLSTLTPRQPTPGKQHPRTRHGFLYRDLAALNSTLAKAGLKVDAVLCRINPERAADDLAAIGAIGPLSHIGQVDAAFEFLPHTAATVAAAARALAANQKRSSGILFFEPLVEMDRTMDASPGLLDSQCNPQPAFHALRCVNSISSIHPQADLHILTAGDDKNALAGIFNATPKVKVCRLEQGLTKTCTVADSDDLRSILEAGETLLLGNF